jgi:drug/metabolite transporter (DMT)-like permease
MMWIFLTLTAAFSQAWWMAWSKSRLQTLRAQQFALFLRIPFVLVFLPVFLAGPKPAVPPLFWGVVVVTAVLESARMITFAQGTREDYYATYSFLQMSTLVIVFLAPLLLKEPLTPHVLGGAACVVGGGLLFYRAGRFTLVGLAVCLIQGFVTTLCKWGVSLSHPTYFMFLMYGLSTVFLGISEVIRHGARATAADFRLALPRTLPLSLVNCVAVSTFMAAITVAPVTHFAILFRTSLIFGFLWSMFWLKEYEAWPWKLAGAALIALGAVWIALV